MFKSLKLKNRYASSNPLTALKIYSLIIVLTSYFIYHSIYGERGYLKLVETNNLILEKKMQLENLKIQKAKLENRIEKIYPKNLNHDLLEEVAKQNLGVIGENEVMIIIDKKNS